MECVKLGKGERRKLPLQDLDPLVGRLRRRVPHGVDGPPECIEGHGMSCPQAAAVRPMIGEFYCSVCRRLTVGIAVIDRANGGIVTGWSSGRRETPGVGLAFSV